MDYRYWDTATFLGWLSEEPDKVPETKPVLDAAEAGNVMLVTSALTIPEVLWLKGHSKIPAPDANKVEAFFKHGWIVVRELDRLFAKEARAWLCHRIARQK